jgi:Flp pilus assembly protein TadG
VIILFAVALLVLLLVIGGAVDLAGVVVNRGQLE